MAIVSLYCPTIMTHVHFSLFPVNSDVGSVRIFQTAYTIVDQMHEEFPELVKDQYWEEVVPKELPYTLASECYRRAEPSGSADHYKVKEADAIYSNLLTPGHHHRKIPHPEDVYGEHPDLDYVS